MKGSKRAGSNMEKPVCSLRREEFEDLQKFVHDLHGSFILIGDELKRLYDQRVPKELSVDLQWKLVVISRLCESMADLIDVKFGLLFRCGEIIPVEPIMARLEQEDKRPSVKRRS